MREGAVLGGWREAAIAFLPSYRRVPGKRPGGGVLPTGNGAISADEMCELYSLEVRCIRYIRHIRYSGALLPRGAWRVTYVTYVTDM